MPPADTERLPVPLEQAEICDRGVRMAVIERELRALDVALAEQKREHKAAVARLLEERTQLAQEIRDREACKEVKVEWKPNYETRQVECYRRDTGQLVRARDMRPEELQASFDDLALASK